MIDAYQIGISLTLENGVSDGLALIRQDLATLDKAIGVTEARLAGLAQVARQSLVPPAAASSPGAAPQPATTAGGIADPLPARPVAVEPVVMPRPVAAPLVPAQPAEKPGPARGPDPAMPMAAAVPARAEAQSAPPTARATAVAREVVAPAPAAPVMPQVAALPPVSASAGLRQADAAPEPQARTVRVAEVPTRPVAVRAVDPGQMQVLPMMPRDMPGSAPPMARAVVSQAVAEGARPVPVVARAAPGAAPTLPVTVGMARQDSLRVAARFGPVEDGTPGRRPREPRAPPQERGIERGAAPTREQAAPVAPRTRQADNQLQTGDVFLDGEKVGRWMIDHLASAASRPSAAATGFDARATPPWNIAGLL